jgi:hypothetical protein
MFWISFDKASMRKAYELAAFAPSYWLSSHHNTFLDRILWPFLFCKHTAANETTGVDTFGSALSTSLMRHRQGPSPDVCASKLRILAGGWLVSGRGYDARGGRQQCCNLSPQTAEPHTDQEDYFRQRHFVVVCHDVEDAVVQGGFRPNNLLEG